MNSRVYKIGASIGYFALLSYLVLLNPKRREVKLPLRERLRLRPIIDSVDDIIHPNGQVWFVKWFYFLLNLFGNIGLFIPFAFVMVFVFRINALFKVALLAFLLSFTIEFLQYKTGWGIADVDDVLLNTLGAVTGFFLYRFFQNRINYSINQ